MKAFNRNPGGLLAALFALMIVFIGATLYEHGIINDDFYIDLLSAVKTEVSSSSELEVHFIDVDQAECILIKAPEKTVLIDAGNVGYEKIIETSSQRNTASGHCRFAWHKFYWTQYFGHRFYHGVISV